MKNLSKISLTLLFTLTSAQLVIARNIPTQTLTITNHTSMPLSLNIAASYHSSQIVDDQKTMSLAPQSQANFEYRLNKKVSGNSLLYFGGLQTIQITTSTHQTNYTALLNPISGLQYFQALQPSGFSYNLLGIYEDTTTHPSIIYLAYDKLNLTLGTM